MGSFVSSSGFEVSIFLEKTDCWSATEKTDIL